MGLRFRRSMSLGGGLRLNLSKSGLGISGGVRGARMGIGPRGARMAAGIPGTGLYFEKRRSLKGSKSKNDGNGSTHPQQQQQKQIKPGFIRSLFMPKDEKFFIQGVNHLLKDNKFDSAENIRKCLNINSSFIDAYFALSLITNDEKERLNSIKNILNNRQKFNQMFNKYKTLIGALLPLTEHVTLYIFNDDLGLELLAAEILEDNGLINEAIDLLEKSSLVEDPALQLSLGELYYQNEQYSKCIELIQGIENNDMIATNALYYKGLAFKKQGMYTAAIDVLRKARRRRKNRDPEILKDIRYSLAETLLADGQRREAAKEFERIMAEDTSYRDVAQRLKELS